MTRRDLLTYDLDPRADHGPFPWKTLVLLVAVVTMAVLLCVAVVVTGREPSTAPPASGVLPAAAAPTVVPLPSPASAPATGSDASERATVPAGSAQAVEAFVRAWLDRNPKTRAAGLSDVAVPALGEQLLLTDPANIPRAAPKGAPVMDDASTYGAQFSQTLSTGMTIRVYLTYDPQARFRWLVTTVEEV